MVPRRHAASYRLIAVAAAAVLGASATVIGVVLVSGLPSAGKTFVADAARREHRILFHVASDDPGSMAHAISAADNAMKFYRARGEAVSIEIVANGSGVRMMRVDTSPVAPSIAYLHATYPAIVLSACGTTLGIMKAREGHDISLLDGVRVTPAGIARIVELQERGWSYVRS